MIIIAPIMVNKVKRIWATFLFMTESLNTLVSAPILNILGIYGIIRSFLKYKKDVPMTTANIDIITTKKFELKPFIFLGFINNVKKRITNKGARYNTV